jgi:hypothetical protein
LGQKISNIFNRFDVIKATISYNNSIAIIPRCLAFGKQSYDLVEFIEGDVLDKFRVQTS